MAFVHGKRAQAFIRDVNNVWNDITPFLNEVTLPGKAGVAETTVFGRGAKTYIGGLLEGQVTMKGYFDPTSTSTSFTGVSNPQSPDQTLAALLGSQAGLNVGATSGKGLTVVAQVGVQSNYGQFILCPSGSSTGEALIMDLVMTDYSVTAPVTGVVAFTATFNLSGAPNLPLTYTSANQTAYAAATYGLQVIRAPVANVFSVGWIAASGGVASASALINTTT
jgi:hypothetical protein